MQSTLAIVKPDAVGRSRTGLIIARLEEEGFSVRGIRMLRLSADQAAAFYSVHHGKPFFASLVRFMTSGPVVVVVLQHENAVARLREVIGATDPAEARAGTIRALYAESKEHNAIHASDSIENARHECTFFFPDVELIPLEVSS